jgi:hypothetical protein
MSDAASGQYPVRVRMERQWEFARIHVLFRLLAAFVLYVVVSPVMGLLLVVGPVITALLANHARGDQFHERYQANYLKALQFIVDLNDYLLVTTDSFPEWGVKGPATVEVNPSGHPTFGSALLRIITVIPHMIVLALLGAVAGIFTLLAMVTVLLDASVPDVLWRFQTGFVNWYARALAYLYSMVEEYPPFQFEPAPVEPRRL